MDATFVTLGRRAFLLSRPRSAVAFGVFVADVAVALQVGKATGREVVFFPDTARAASSPLLHLQSTEVAIRVLPGARWVGDLMFGVRWRAMPRTAWNGTITVVQQAIWSTTQYIRTGRVSPVALLTVLRTWQRQARWVRHRAARHLLVFLANALDGVGSVRRSWIRRERAALSDWADRVHGAPDEGAAASFRVRVARRLAARADHLRTRLNTPSVRASARLTEYLEPILAPEKSMAPDVEAPLPTRVREWFRTVALATNERLEAWKRPTRTREVHWGHDLRQLMARTPVLARLDETAARQAAAEATASGIDPAAPMVVVHVREGSSKPALGVVDRDRDGARNAEVSTYLPAIDFLVEQGFTVVRIGDASMTPVVRPGVVDLARKPGDHLALDLWCLERSRFMIASDSGPSLLPWIFGVPCLGVNIVNAQGMFPLRSRDLYIVKRLRRVPSGEAVALTEMLAPDFQRLLRRRLYKERALEYVDNSPGEILDAVRAMVQGLAAPAASTPDQDRYGTLVDELRRQEHAQTKLLEKSGTAESFLGDGRIVASFAAQYLDGPRRDSRS